MAELITLALILSAFTIIFVGATCYCIENDKVIFNYYRFTKIKLSFNNSIGYSGRFFTKKDFNKYYKEKMGHLKGTTLIRFEDILDINDTLTFQYKGYKYFYKRVSDDFVEKTKECLVAQKKFKNKITKDSGVLPT